MILDTHMHDFGQPSEPATCSAAERDSGHPLVDHAAPRILLAEDDYELRLLISQALRSRGYEVIEMMDGWQLRQRLDHCRIFFAKRWDFDLMVSDIRMPGMGGLEALATLQEHPAPPPAILITAFGDKTAYANASRLGATAFFDKPIDLDEFCAYVQKILPVEGTNQGRGGCPLADA